jgi:hypothetical protein
MMDRQREKRLRFEGLCFYLGRGLGKSCREEPLAQQSAIIYSGLESLHRKATHYLDFHPVIIILYAKKIPTVIISFDLNLVSLARYKKGRKERN